jgi:hypothetical protein
VQRLSIETLTTRLGDLRDRVKKHVIQNRITVALDGGRTAQRIVTLLLNITTAIAKERGWVHSVKMEGSNFVFNLNRGYFAPKDTAHLLTDR